MVTWSLQNSQGGDIVIPKIKSYKILDIAKAIDPKRKIKIIGLRPGEKIYEELISEDETSDIYDIGKYYIVKSNLVFRNKNLKKIGKKIRLLNSYNSKENSFLSVSKLSQIIKNLFNAKIK
jgi:FlaA1/EpsC-like NDP-sugar epimerase